MKIVIDTSVLIDHIRKTKKTNTLLSEIIQYHQPLVSEITAFELLIGKTKANKYFIEGILENLEHLPFNDSCKLQAVDIYIDLKKRNKLIPPPDIFIAATALSPISNIKHKAF